MKSYGSSSFPTMKPATKKTMTTKGVGSCFELMSFPYGRIKAIARQTATTIATITANDPITERT